MHKGSRLKLCGDAFGLPHTSSADLHEQTKFIGVVGKKVRGYKRVRKGEAEDEGRLTSVEKNKNKKVTKYTENPLVETSKLAAIIIAQL